MREIESFNWILSNNEWYRFNPRLRCQTESRYVQTVPDGKCLCPDPPRRKVPMSRLSCVQNFSCVHRAFKSPHVQTFVRSKLPMSRLSCVPKENSCVPNLIICAFMSRLSCVQKALCPDFRAFKNAYVQTFVRSKRKFVRSKNNNLCVHVQTFVRSKMPMSRLSCVSKENSCAPKIIICAFMSRLSCVQKCLCPDFRAFKNAYVLTFVRSKRKFVRSKFNNLCVDVQTIVRSEGLMSRLSCVQKCLCPDFLYVQKLTMCTKFDDLISPKETSPKWFGQSNFLNSSLIMAKVEHTHLN